MDVINHLKCAETDDLPNPEVRETIRWNLVQLASRGHQRIYIELYQFVLTSQALGPEVSFVGEHYPDP